LEATWANSATATQGPVGESGSVLVIDDDPECRSLVQLLLERERIPVAAAAGDAQAREHDLTKVRLVLLDLNLRQQSGLQTARALRDRGYTGPIVAYTGTEPVRNALADSGITDFLSKDSPIAELIAICRRGLSTAPLPTTFAVTGRDWKDSPRRRDLQRLYVDGLYESLDALRRAIQMHNPQEVADIAHRLAGTGGLYGLPAITNQGRQLHDAIGRHASHAELEALVDELEIHVDGAASVLRGAIEPR
jgi:DNA-binding response OmpR family regulator